MCHWLEKLTFNFADRLKNKIQVNGIKLIFAGEEDQKLIIELERNRWFFEIYRNKENVNELLKIFNDPNIYPYSEFISELSILHVFLFL